MGNFTLLNTITSNTMHIGCLLTGELTSPCALDISEYQNLKIKFTQLPTNGSGLVLPR